MKKLNLSSRISSHFMSYLLLGLILPGGQFKTYDLQAADLAPSLAQQCAELLVQQGPRALPPAVTLEDISNTVSDHDRSTLLWEHYFSTPIDYSLATAWEELFNKSDILFDNSKKDERKITSQVATKVARMYWQNPAAAKAFFSQKIQEQFLGYAKFVDDNQGWKRHYVILRILHKAFQETNLMSQLAPTFQAGAVNAIRILFQNCLWSAEAFIVGREHLKQIIPEFIWPQRISAPQDLQIINNSLALLFPSLDQLESFPAKELAHLLAPLVDRTALVGPSPLKQLLAEKDKDDASASSDAFSAKKNDGPSPMDILISTLEDYAENKKMDAKELRRSVKFYLNLKLPEFTAEDLINDNFFQVIRTSPFSHLILENQYFRDEQLPSLINHPHFIKAFNDALEFTLAQKMWQPRDKAALNENFRLEYYTEYLLPLVSTLLRIAQLANPSTAALPSAYWPSLQNCLKFIKNNLAYIYRKLQEEQKMMEGAEALIASLNLDLSSLATQPPQDSPVPEEDGPAIARTTAQDLPTDEAVLLHQVFKTQYGLLLPLVNIIHPQDFTSQWHLYEILGPDYASNKIKNTYHNLILKSLPIFLKANKNFKGLIDGQAQAGRAHPKRTKSIRRNDPALNPGR